MPQGVAHDTFAIEIQIDAAPSEVFAAYADVHARQRWAAPSADAIVYDNADFRVGHGDAYRCGPKNDLRFFGTATYLEIVEDTRFVFVESVRTADGRLSLAMATWELFPEGKGTRLRSTTQMISFVGVEMVAASRSGTRAALDNLAAAFSRKSG